MPQRTRAELQAQIEILDYVLKSLCIGELHHEGREFIEKLKVRIQTQINNDTTRP